MIFHENRLLADDSHEISYFFFRKLEKMPQNLPSAAVVIGALRVNRLKTDADCISVSCKVISVAHTFHCNVMCVIYMVMSVISLFIVRLMSITYEVISCAR